MEEEIVLYCTRCGKLFNVSQVENKNLRQSICDSIWEVTDFAKHFKCWHCLQIRELDPYERSALDLR